MPSSDDFNASKKHEDDLEEAISPVSSIPPDGPLLKKTVRRMDLIVLPVLTILLAFCFIDRANMGLAAVAGMIEELELEAYDFSITLIAFFPGYVLFAIPSNYILARTKVRYWLTALSFSFGIFTMCMGFVPNFGALVAMRIFLGVFEAGVFPAIIVVVGAWYPRNYLGKRIAFVFTGANVIASLAGILAYAFSRINAGGYAGWRWIFILEGLMTIVVVVAAYFFIDEYPSKSRFLSSEKRTVALTLLAQDRHEREDENVSAKLVMRIVLSDWKLWAFGLMYMVGAATIYAFTYFMPLILTGQMGYSGAIAQLLSTPPYFWGFLLATSTGWLADKWQLRSPFIMFFNIKIIVGATLVRWGPNIGSQMLGLFLTLGGCQSLISTAISFGQNNAATRVKRNVGSGLQLTLGAIGGIIGSISFRSQDAPSYTPGIITILTLNGSCLCLVVIVAVYMKAKNQKCDKGEYVIEDQPGFRYTL